MFYSHFCTSAVFNLHHSMVEGEFILALNILPDFSDITTFHASQIGESLSSLRSYSPFWVNETNARDVLSDNKLLLLEMHLCIYV